MLRRHSPGTDEEGGTGTERSRTPGSHKDESGDTDDEAPSESPMEEYPPDMAHSSIITLQNAVTMENFPRQSPLSGSSWVPNI